MARDFKVFALDLNAGLFAYAVVAFARTVQRLFFARERMLHRGEFHDVIDFPDFQLIALLSSDSGDEGKVFVVATAPIALSEPTAHVAMEARFGIRVGVTVVSGVFEAFFDVTVVGRIFGDAILLGRMFFSGRNDPHRFRKIVGDGDLRGVEIERSL